MDQLPVNPSWRNLVGIGLILLLIVGWSVAAVSLFDLIADAAWPLQALFFLVAGTAWVLPLKPLLRWMNGVRNGASDGT